MIARLNHLLKARAPALHRGMRAAVRAVFPGGTACGAVRALPRRLAGHWVWVHPKFIGDSLAIEPEVQQRLADTLRPGDTFLDVGAHVGWHALLAARLVGPHGRVCAFEPSPPNLAVLDYHRAKNRLAQLEVVDRAVAATDDQEVTFHLLNAGNSTSNSLTFDRLDPAVPRIASTALTVRTTTLDTFTAQRGLAPALVKIDVEGGEYDVLLGARGLLQRCRPRIILALHPNWLPCCVKPDDVAAVLTRLGYRISRLDGRPVDSWTLAEYWCEIP